MTYKMFWGDAVPSRTENNKVLVSNHFTQTRVTVLNIKKTVSLIYLLKLKNKKPEKSKRKTKKKNQSRKGLCLPNASAF